MFEYVVLLHGCGGLRRLGCPALWFPAYAGKTVMDTGNDGGGDAMMISSRRLLFMLVCYLLLAGLGL